MAKIVKLTVVENATQKNVIGASTWAAVRKKSSAVTIEATTAPDNNAGEWKEIKWSGGSAVKDKPNRRTISCDASGHHTVTAELGGAKLSVDLWVVWATVKIETKGDRPKAAAPFDKGSRDNSDKLGAVTYKSATSSLIDEAAGVFVDNMGASGKVVAVATLQPSGVAKALKAGWSFKRQVLSRIWIDGVKQEDKKTWTKTWADDTSSPTYQRLTPDADDKIYDLDAPDLRWGQESYETYNNFQQWVEWNGEACSDPVPWSWQARWHVNRDINKQIELNDLQPSHIKLPDAPHYPVPNGR
jgi:hypothetical protein